MPPNHKPMRRYYRIGIYLLCILLLCGGWFLYQSWKLFQKDMHESAEATKHFEEAFKPLIFYGDNYRKSVELREKCFNYSVKYGIDACEVAETWFEIYRTTSYLNGDPQADEKREEMLESCLLLSKNQK